MLSSKKVYKMEFVKNLQIEKISGFLDDENAVRKARISLEEKTAEAYKKLGEAKRNSYLESHSIYLD